MTDFFDELAKYLRELWHQLVKWLTEALFT